MRKCPNCNFFKIEKFRRGEVIVIACRKCGFRDERKSTEQQ